VLERSVFIRQRKFQLAIGAALILLMSASLVLGAFRSRIGSAVEVYQGYGIGGLYQSVSDTYFPWSKPNIPWESATPESMDFDSAKLSTLRDSLSQLETTGFLVVRKNRIVDEWYEEGHGPNKTHYTASLQKAIAGSMALLVELNDDRISLEDPVWKYIPAWKDDAMKSKITIRHLITHSSGIDDVSGDEPGWKHIYHNELDQRFPLALDKPVVLFEPGSRYSYSGVGFYTLAYAMAASLQDAPETSVRKLLENRVMKPIGVPIQAWRMSYGETYSYDGLELNAIGSGGYYTPRAVARIGQLMLDRGIAGGISLIASDKIDMASTYSGVPVERESDNPQPAIGLGWWVNSDGFWPSLPRDAFVGAGAQHQILLVVPSLDLVMVRMGEELGEDGWNGDFWMALEEQLFRPLMDSLVIRGVAQ